MNIIKKLILTIIFYNLNIFIAPNFSRIEQPKQDIDSSIFRGSREEVERSREKVEQRNSVEEKDKKIEEGKKDLILWSYKFYKYNFNWQFISSIFIFFLVIAMVILGLYLSYLQFTQSSSSENIKESDNDKSNDIDKEINKISFSMDKVEITSSVIGLIILIISFAFFYLYIAFIYPISIYPISVEDNLPFLKPIDTFDENNQE